MQIIHKMKLKNSKSRTWNKSSKQESKQLCPHKNVLKNKNKKPNIFKLKISNL
jgi:hypothetical protein